MASVKFVLIIVLLALGTVGCSFMDPQVARITQLHKEDIIVISDAGIIYELPSEPIRVGIQGPVDVIGDINNLQAKLDLSGLSPGEHDVELVFDLPSNVSVVDSPMKLHIIIHEDSNTQTDLPDS